MKSRWFRRNRPRDLMQFWEDRAKKYGRRAVLNLGYADGDYESVTAAQQDELFPLLRKMLTGNERLVLDFGCGAGRFGAALSTLVGARVVAVDRIKRLLDLAPPAEDVEYRLMEDWRIPLADHSVGLIWVFSVLGGITDETDLHRTLGEFQRVLARGGLVFMVENTSEKPGASYWSYRSIDTYRELLSFANLRHLGDIDELSERLSILAGRCDVPSC